MQYGVEMQYGAEMQCGAEMQYKELQKIKNPEFPPGHKAFCDITSFPCRPCPVVALEALRLLVP